MTVGDRKPDPQDIGPGPLGRLRGFLAGRADLCGAGGGWWSADQPYGAVQTGPGRLPTGPVTMGD